MNKRVFKLLCCMLTVFLIAGAVPVSAATADESYADAAVDEEAVSEEDISEEATPADEDPAGKEGETGGDAGETPDLSESAEELKQTEEEIPEETEEPLPESEEALPESEEALPESEEALPDSSEEEETDALIGDGETDWTVSFEPVVNTTKTAVKLAGWEQLSASDEVDTIKIEAVMTYGGKTTRSVTKTLAISEFDSEGSAEVDFGDYGKWTVTVSFLNGSAEVRKNAAVVTGILAEAYNISPVSATLPVTFFSLNLWGDSNIRENGPIILMMERPNAYDWDQLPEGVYGIPYLSPEEVSYQPGSFSGASDLFQSRVPIMAAYVHDLLEVDPDAVIHLYCVDIYASIVQQVLYANGVPEDHYTITLMSDGSYTFSKFSSTYNGTDPAAQHAQLVAEWEEAKAFAYENGTIKEGFETAVCGKYLWALVDSEPNAELWVTRKDLMKTENDGNAFGAQVQANTKLVQVNIGNLLKQNILPSEENTVEFKALYNFNDSYFAEAEEQGKDVMVFLGTRVTGEETFENYARFVMTYYGDRYIYYYKGHPGTPTDLFPEKIGQLERLGITDVDSSVAAELILFFNPQVYLSGYSSTTFESVEPGMAKGMFQMTKAQGLASPVYENRDFWISMVTESSEQKIKDICIEGNQSYLVEFSDSIIADKGYDIAIWDATVPEIRYYIDEDGSYRLVGKESGILGAPVIAPGVYAIGSSIQRAEVLDVYGGSKNNGANVQLYRYNASDAQKWSISYDENNFATIINVGSGLALDAYGGKTANGTNIQQYRANGSKAQKWILTKNNDGSVRITSAASAKAVLDVYGGKAVDKANVQLYASNGTKAQDWFFYAVEPDVPKAGQAELADGYYTIATGVNTNLLLQVAGWSSANGGNFQVGTASGGENQIFYITKMPDGYYQIRNVWSGRNLNLDKGAIVPATNVHQWSSGGGTSEWAIYLRSGGSYVIQNVASGLMLNLSGGKNASGTNVDGYSANGTLGQTWLIHSVASPEEQLLALAEAHKTDLADGVYTAYAGRSGSMVLDVKGSSSADGANIQIYRYNQTMAQLWIVSHDADGFVTIRSLSSGKALDVSGAVKRNGANVQQYRRNGTAAQKWIAIRQADGTYKVVSAVSEHLVLDIFGGALISGRNVQVYGDNGSNAQCFRFVMRG